jgi:hypothetical protein
MRGIAIALITLLAISNAHAADDSRSLAFCLGGFSGNDTSGVAIGFYSLRPKNLGWYINGTVSSSVDKDDNEFRPIPGDIRVDSDSDSVTVNIGFTYSLGAVAPYVGAGITQISEYGLYRAPSAAFWYEEKDSTEANFNFGILVALHHNLGLDLGANSANDEWVVGLTWRFR